MSDRFLFEGQGTCFYGSGAVTVSALAAGAQEDLQISDSNAKDGDVVCVTLAAAGYEAGMIVTGYVSAAGAVEVRVNNTSGGALTGGATTAYYTLIRKAE